VSTPRFEQPGLRLRLGGGARRISSQHRQLDTLFGHVLETLAQGDEAAARDAFARFRDAWEAHTSLEDHFYFPALRALRPALGGPLLELSAEHAALVGDLEGLAAGFGEGAARDEALDRLVEAIAAHEAREEALLAELAGAAEPK